MSVVPSIWLDIENNTCLWPTNINSKMFYNAVRTKETFQPSECQTCRINIKFKTNDYQAALSRLKVLEEMSDDPSSCATSEDDVGKRKIKINQKYTSWPGDSQMSNKRVTQSTFGRNITQMSSESDLSDNENQLPEVPQLRKNTVSTASTSIQSFSSNTQLNKSTCAAVDTVLEKTLIAENCEEPLFETNVANLCKAVARLEALTKCSIRKMEVLHERVEYVTDLILALPTSNQNTEEKYDADSLLAETKESLEAFEQKLEDTVFFNSVCSTLVRVGGKDYAGNIRRILPLLLAHDLCLKINWSGRNDKIAFKELKNYRKLILVIVRRNPKCKETTMAMVDVVLKQWFRSTSDREGGRERRRHLNSNTTIQP